MTHKGHDRVIHRGHDRVIHRGHDRVTHRGHDRVTHRGHDRVTQRGHGSMTHRGHGRMTEAIAMQISIYFLPISSHHHESEPSIEYILLCIITFMCIRVHLN